MSYMKGLRCRECGREYPKEALYVCEYCFGSLEVTYDYDRIKEKLTREAIASRPKNLWRYRELLPIDGNPTDGFNSGYTPLVRAHNLGKVLGVKELYIKDDSVCHPTLSFKDRVVSIALSRAKELGYKIVGCASTGNLANSVASQSAIAGLKSYIFIPADLEAGKVIGTQIFHPNLIAVEGNYDEVNRLCSEIAAKYKWAFVNVNIGPYYAEGSKTYGFEIAEQLGWKTPDHLISPCAGGSLITKIYKSFKEFHKLGLIDKPKTKFYRGPGARLRPHRQHDQGEVRDHEAGQAENDREIPGHRQSGRRLLRQGDGRRNLRLGRVGDRRRDRRSDQAAGPDRGDLHRNGRRRHRRHDKEIDRAGGHTEERIGRHLRPATASRPR